MHQICRNEWTHKLHVEYIVKIKLIRIYIWNIYLHCGLVMIWRIWTTSRCDDTMEDNLNNQQKVSVESYHRFFRRFSCNITPRFFLSYSVICTLHQQWFRRERLARSTKSQIFRRTQDSSTNREKSDEPPFLRSSFVPLSTSLGLFWSAAIGLLWTKQDPLWGSTVSPDFLWLSARFPVPVAEDGAGSGSFGLGIEGWNSSAGPEGRKCLGSDMTFLALGSRARSTDL